MKKYIIGGYVRDSLMGRQPHDKDFAVVGATVEEMKSLGFKQVGKDFPVFLHPETGEEYALARTERKTGDKHTDFAFDFSPEVTLYDDCLRRDFTCNALALDEESGEIIDYFGGREDIEKKIIRIIDEQNFKLDPLRILRAYRFAAVLNFDIEPHSKEVLQKMVGEGMLKHLTPERVWQETKKALAPQADSQRYFAGLAEIGGLHDWFPEIEALLSVPEYKKYHASGNSFRHVMCALRRVQNDDEITKWAVLNHDDGKAATPPEILPHHYNHDVKGVNLIARLCRRLKTPNEYRDFALLFCREHMRIAQFENMKLSTQYDTVKQISDNFHNHERLERFLRCFYADYYADATIEAEHDDKTFEDICRDMRNIFDIMEGVGLQNLPAEQQNSLQKQSGERFGAIYREYMIEYLKKHLAGLCG